MSQVLIRGTFLQARLEYVRKSHGESGLEKVIAALSVEAQGLFGSTVILPSSRFPFAQLLEFDRVASQLLKPESGQYLREAEAIHAENSFKVFEPFFRSTQNRVELRERTFSSLWKEEFSTIGELVEIEVDPDYLDGKVIKVPTGASKWLALAVAGYFSKQIALCGGQKIAWRTLTLQQNELSFEARWVAGAGPVRLDTKPAYSAYTKSFWDPNAE